MWTWIAAGISGGSLFLDRQTEPEITAAVSLDRDGFDGSAYRARERELENALPDAHPIGAFVLPPCLRQGEAAVLRALFETGQSDPGTLSYLVIEE